MTTVKMKCKVFYLPVKHSVPFSDEFVSMYRPAIHLHYDEFQHLLQQILHDMYTPNICHLNQGRKIKKRKTLDCS